MAAKNNKLQQQWDVVYAKEYHWLKKGDENKDFGLRVGTDFHIVSKMTTGRYVDLVGNNLVLKTPNSFKSQIWYFDQKSKTIKNRRTSYSISIQSSGRGTNLSITSTNSKWW